MGDAVLPQHREVHRCQEIVVADLDGVLGVARKLGEKLVQPVSESLRTNAARFCDRLELEYKGSGILREIPLIRCVDLFDEEIGVEKIRVDLARFVGLLSLGEAVNGDLAPDLADAGKAGRQALGIASQHRLGGRPIVAGIDSNRPE